MPSKEHDCEPSKSCICRIYAEEPEDECPQHGYLERPYKCKDCGKFLKS